MFKNILKNCLQILLKMLKNISTNISKISKKFHKYFKQFQKISKIFQKFSKQILTKYFEKITIFRIFLGYAVKNFKNFRTKTI